MTYTKEQVTNFIVGFATKTGQKQRVSEYLKEIFPSELTEQDHLAHNERSKTATLGMVVFFEPDYQTKTIKEVGHSPICSTVIALSIYAETPNPASQLLLFNEDSDTYCEERLYLLKCTKDREWLDGLFKCI